MKRNNMTCVRTHTRLALAVLVLGAFGCQGLRAQSFLFLESSLMSLRESAAPRFHDGKLILTYKPEAGNRYVRYVGARFAHEDFRTLHLYRRNDNGIFFLVYSPPEETRHLKYRIVVDGLWMTDPTNADTQANGALGVAFSTFEIDEPPRRRVASPEWVGSNRVCFTYKGLSGDKVYVVGDFNSWNPYAHPLEEETKGSGLYRTCVTVGVGRHHYYFLVNGEKTLDVLNGRRARDRNGREVCTFDSQAGRQVREERSY